MVSGKKIILNIGYKAPADANSTRCPDKLLDLSHRSHATMYDWMNFFPPKYEGRIFILSLLVFLSISIDISVPNLLTYF